MACQTREMQRSRMRRRILGLTVLLLVLTLPAAACGGDGGGEAATESTTAAEPTTTSDSTGTGGGGATTLELAADPDGAFAFDKQALEAAAGAVTIEFTNDASVPHNVTIEGNGIEEVATETVTGDSSSLTADLPAGTYDFYCSVGNHRGAGMEGTLAVN